MTDNELKTWATRMAEETNAAAPGYPWSAEEARAVLALFAERDEAKRKLDGCEASREAAILRADQAEEQQAAAEAREKALREALEVFISIAAAVQRVAAERWERTRLLQEAANLARQGKADEARALVNKVDRSPTVWDFSLTVSQLAEAEKQGRAALAAR